MYAIRSYPQLRMAAPYPVEAIINLLRSDEPIEPVVRNLMADLLARGSKSIDDIPDEDLKLLSLKLHNHGGKSNPSRIAITVEDELRLYDLYAQALADDTVKNAAKFMKENHNIGIDKLKSIRAANRRFENWFSELPLKREISRQFAQTIFSQLEVQKKLEK